MRISVYFVIFFLPIPKFRARPGNQTRISSPRQRHEVSIRAAGPLGLSEESKAQSAKIIPRIRAISDYIYEYS